MYIYINTFTCIHVYMCIPISLYRYHRFGQQTHMHKYTCIFLHAHVPTDIYMYRCIHI